MYNYHMFEGPRMPEEFSEEELDKGQKKYEEAADHAAEFVADEDGFISLEELKKKMEQGGDLDEAA